MLRRTFNPTGLNPGDGVTTMIKTDRIPMTDAEAARYLAHTHPLSQQEDERPEDFVLRIVRAYDNIKAIRVLQESK